MNAERNKVVVRRLYEDFFSRGRLDVADEIFAPDYVNHEAGWPEPVRGPDGMRMIVSTFRAAFSGLTLTVDDQYADGDVVTTRWTGRGKHTAPLFGIPPTGVDMVHTGISIERIRDGKIVETWVERDKLGMLQQLGAIPQPAAAPA